MTERRCPQCYQMRPYPSGFIGARGKPVNLCRAVCQGRYRGWDRLGPDERLAKMPARVDPPTLGRVLFVRRSHNTKTGPIPLSISERGTCPRTCALYEAGCYASYGKLGSHWRGTGKSKNNWLPWPEFLERVAELPDGTLWRHNEAGDLQGDGVHIDRQRLAQLVRANRGKRGFTFTHYPYDRGPDMQTVLNNEAAIIAANALGFTINVSTDSIEQADAVRALSHHGKDRVPVVVLLPENAPDKMRTPRGHHVIVCPAQTRVGTITCASCRLCANPDRKVIIGFRAHGQSSGLITHILKRRPELEHAPRDLQGHAEGPGARAELEGGAHADVQAGARVDAASPPGGRGGRRRPRGECHG